MAGKSPTLMVFAILLTIADLFHKKSLTLNQLHCILKFFLWRQWGFPFWWMCSSPGRVHVKWKPKFIIIIFLWKFFALLVYLELSFNRLTCVLYITFNLIVIWTSSWLPEKTVGTTILACVYLFKVNNGKTGIVAKSVQS